jgi:large subunit ribosomal protein L22
MRGPKLNEGATAIGERHGTKATAKYVRSSAYKARVVLDLIRGLDVKRADEVLQFTQRGIAHDIRKVLASAVANATDPDNGAYIADADELFVLACFADEGPTLRRFRPRARGRATRIRKRTCHITIVVARMSDERLEIISARAEGAGAGAAASRRARVERSRQRAAAAKEQVDAIDADEAAEEIEDAEELDDETAAEETDAADVADEVGTDEGSASDEAAEAPESDAARGESEADDEPAFEQGEWDGSVLPDAEGNGPETHPIKGNADSMLYHTPDSRYYKVTKAEVWFDSEQSAEAAGFSKPGADKDED